MYRSYEFICYYSSRTLKPKMWLYSIHFSSFPFIVSSKFEYQSRCTKKRLWQPKSVEQCHCQDLKLLQCFDWINMAFHVRISVMPVPCFIWAQRFVTWNIYKTSLPNTENSYLNTLARYRFSKYTVKNTYFHTIWKEQRIHICMK